MRKDSIMQVINAYCQTHTLTDLKQGVQGISVYEIAEKLHLLRNNVNVDVNKLFQEGKVIKICGNKMYRFYSQEHFMRVTHKTLPAQTTCSNLNELLGDLHEVRDYEDPFTALIGYNASLKNAILSAKAGILYPGGALHTMLLGESGVGKSLFAEKIFTFGKKEGIFTADSQFVVFNCADYANNAELLLSQLFGSVKGAYTGADATKEGLLKRADGGMLFLDEVHRLPPEGQEMLFYFIDKKKYRMLGEANSEHEAKVTLVLATTEDPDNHLLTTFLRRIPMVIKIPSLKEKSFNERKQMILYLFSLEASAIGCPIVIDKDTMATLLLYQPKGNIGQLKNDIKLAIARSYLEMRDQQNKEITNEIRIHNYALSYQVKDGMSDLDIEQRREIEKVLVQDTYIVEPYDVIMVEEDDTALFVPPQLDVTKSDIQTSFEEYVEKIARSLEHDQSPSFIIDTEIREIMAFIHEWVLHNMNVLIGRSQSAALAFYLKNIRENRLDAFSHEEDLKDYDVATMEDARSLIRAIEQHFHLRIPAQELHTLACILNTFTTNTLQSCGISMFVVAHGTSLASNIADVVNELLSIHYLIPMDMPLTKNVNQIMDELILKIKQEPKGNEILLFVDMGSLTSLEETLRQKTSYHVVVIPTINTLLLLDAARKAVFMQYTLSNILQDVMRMNQKLDATLEHHIHNHIAQSSEKIIYTICYSGDGTAHYLEKYLKDLLEQEGIFSIDILALSNDSLIKIRSMIEETSKNKEVLCMIGNVDPGLHEYPFISMEDILMSDGVQRLFEIIGDIDVLHKSDVVKSFERDVFVDVAFESIDKYLMYLNSKKLYPLLMKFIEGVEKELQKTLNNRTLTRLIVHMSCMIERLLFDEYHFEQNEETMVQVKEHSKLYTIVTEQLEAIRLSFHITINQEECYYLMQIILDDTDENAHVSI